MLDLLPLNDGQTYNIVLIKHLKNVISKLKQQVARSSSKTSRNCSNNCYTAAINEKHIVICMQNKAAAIRLPYATKIDPHSQN